MTRHQRTRGEWYFPQTPLRFVDAHVHLPAYSDPQVPIDSARRMGAILLSCTVNLDEVETNLRLRSEFPASIRSFIGVHPSDAVRERPSERIGRLVTRCDGIGEIGLDPKYSDTSTGSPQMDTFIDQLELAERSGKPVQVHSRGAESACLEALGSYRLRSVLMHWFEGEDALPLVNSKGYFVSLGPSVLYSKKLRRIASNTPVERLLTESDGPVFYRPLGDASGPGLIPSVLFCVAELKRLKFEEISRVVVTNLDRFLQGAH